MQGFSPCKVPAAVDGGRALLRAAELSALSWPQEAQICLSVTPMAFGMVKESSVCQGCGREKMQPQGWERAPGAIQNRTIEPRGVERTSKTTQSNHPPISSISLSNVKAHLNAS